MENACPSMSQLPAFHQAGRQVLDKINQVRDEFGITVILAEQDVRRALKLGDSLLANGKGALRKAARITGIP